ncbi:MAG TPA: hypothetical protein EYQ81_16165 [Sneathiellales bacterium]|nr:hypothetical protein [Sneathiellales bacterium]
MPDWLEKVKGWVNRITELGLGLIALGIILQILFGSHVQFVTGDIVGNLTGLIGSLGDNGLVGLISLAIIIWLFQKK